MSCYELVDYLWGVVLVYKWVMNGFIELISGYVGELWNWLWDEVQDNMWLCGCGVVQEFVKNFYDFIFEKSMIMKPTASAFEASNVVIENGKSKPNIFLV